MVVKRRKKPGRPNLGSQFRKLSIRGALELDLQSPFRVREVQKDPGVWEELMYAPVHDVEGHGVFAQL